MDTAEENENWATLLIDGLIRQGVDYFCCAPGSRSTPLLLAIANHAEAKKTVHFDERGLCFHAVGYAKACHKPACVVVTSGTAVGNLLPGVMEACNAHLPLLLLTADRPPELRDCGANQTSDQVKIFQNHVRWQVDLPCPDARIHERYLASTVAHAVSMATFPHAGPVHINCMFREPLLKEVAVRVSAETQVHVAHPRLHPSEETLAHWTELLSVRKNGIILAGSDDRDHSAAIFALADRLQWPIFPDVLSPVRSYENHPSLITHFDPILKVNPSLRPEAIIQFGDRFTSKTLAQWLDRQTPEFFLHISDCPDRQDPSHLVSHRLLTCPGIFTEELLFRLEDQDNEAWRSSWKGWDNTCKEALAGFFSSSTQLTEPGVIWEIASFLSEEWALFLANSMPIRDANQFFLPSGRCGPVFGNRGVSGIDGNIATAAGIAEGCNKPTLALLGDLTFLHDLNSLPWLNQSRHPVVLCVVNNGGGGIFSFLPVAKREEAFEEMIATSHNHTFAAAAALFNIPYHHPQSPEEFGRLLFHQKKQPHSCILEITTERSDNVRVHEHILSILQSCLTSAHSPVETPISLH